MQSGGTREAKLPSACIFTLVAYGGGFREKLRDQTIYFSFPHYNTQFIKIWAANDALALTESILAAH
jgi:hypothetical protein